MGKPANALHSTSRPTPKMGGTVPTAGRTAMAFGYLRSKLGAAGSLVVAILVFCAIFAEFLASDLPIACKIHGQIALFGNVTRPPALVAEGRGSIERQAEWAWWPVVRYGPQADVEERDVLSAPSQKHPFGTDLQGRDVFGRVVHGARTYLIFAGGAVLFALLVGSLLGALAGVFGGPVDAVVGRSIETVSAFPPLVLVLGIQAAAPYATTATLFFAIALTRWPEVARLVRAEVVQTMTRDYVMAARALGASPFRVLHKHVIPNIRGALVVLGALALPGVILIEASLDFLRVTDPTFAASWGETMSEFRDAHGAWWLLAFPGALLFVTVVALTLVGEARRDTMDPRAR